MRVSACEDRVISSFEVSFDVLPDGSGIVFAGQGSESADLFLMHLDTQKIEQLTDTRDDEISPACSPDGRMVAYTGGPRGESQIAVREISGGTPRYVTPAGWRCGLPAWQNDGKALLFIRGMKLQPDAQGGYPSWVDWDYWKDSLQAGEASPSRLTTGLFAAAGQPCPGRAADEVFVACDLPGSTGASVCRIAPDWRKAPDVILRGEKGSNSLGISIIGYDLDVSVDGSVLAFAAYADLAWNIWTIRGDGSRAEQVTHRLRDLISNPRFVPGTRKLLYLVDPKRDEHPDLWEVDLDTGFERRLAPWDLFERPMEYRTTKRTKPRK